MNSDNYLSQDFQDIPTLPPPGLEISETASVESWSALSASSRRQFLQRLGGGIFIFVSLDLLVAQDARGRGGFGRGGGLPSDFNAFLRIGEDGKVTGFTGKIEMGQGPITSLPQMLAEELEVPVDSVSMVMGDTSLCPWDMGTFGSMTTRNFGPSLRAAAAEARGVLMELAAESLNVPAAQLVAKDGTISDRQNSQRRVTYGQLAKGKIIERHLQTRPPLKNASEFKAMGKPLVHRDAVEKVTGKAKYAGDYRLPGMLYARLLRPPAHGAKLKTVDTAPAKSIPGIQVVQEGDLVAVLHEHPDAAEAALAKIKAEFDVPEAKVDDKNIFDHLLQTGTGLRPLGQGGQGGNLEEGKGLATKKFEKTYLNPYVAHAAMETHTALASIEGEKATVWTSTQNPFTCQQEIASALSLPTPNVRIITPYVGGGFGGKTQNSQAVEAARLAKIVGKPVQVCRTRAEEFFYDTFRPAAFVKIDSGIDDNGKIVYWDYAVGFAGERGAAHFYALPNHRTSSGGPASSHPFATGAWRAPGNNTNTVARESHIELMAAAAGIDPIEFRLKNLTDARMIRVLKAAAEKFGWTPAKSPSKRGYGVACGTDAGTYVAGIAEVAVDPKTAAVQVKRVVCAQDMGTVVNPEGAQIQMEGCITMGLGYALTEEVHFQGGKVLEANFDTYELPKFSWLPRIETVLVENNELAPQGGGEPAIILMGALVANAVHDATGARLLRLPITPDRLKAALPKA